MADTISPGRAALIVSTASVVIAVIAYGPAILGNYGRLDDYGYVFASRTGGLDYSRQFLIDSGRPIPAVVMTTLAPDVHTVEALWLFRLASTVVLALGAATGALMMLRVSDKPWGVPAFALAVCTGGVALSTTSAPSAATWAIISGGLLAFPAAMAAGLWATTQRSRWWLVSAVLVLVAVFSYQQVAPIAVLPTMLWSAHRWARREVPMWSRTVVVAAITIAGLVANALFVRERNSVAMARITNATPSERFTWFTDEFLPRTIDLHIMPSTESLIWSIVLLMALLLFPAVTGPRFLAGSAAVVLAWAGTALAVVPLELWASFRLAAASQFVLWVGAATVFSTAALRLRRVHVRTAIVVAAAGVTVGSLGVAGMRAEKYLADPNERDWAAVKCAVKRQDGVNLRTNIRLNPFFAGQSEVIAMDEYGAISSSVAWAAQPAVWLAAAEMPGRDPRVQPHELTVIPPGEPARRPMNILLTGRC